ncbi:DJ-1/PfpI family protein [Gryllotalpicola protaetiae]|uniref:DJ-1/PfpI family protein n=2 Tax=Gryllotalpicola protaetiae TaxID=2419771 RepID=A0A387BKF8_9MICO|nr:DJ-1/PfpI family protein [Gryllotalpicola protaetiae]
MRVQIAVFDGFDEIDVFGPFEALAAGGAEVELAAAHGAGVITSQRGVSLNVGLALLDPGKPRPDGVIVPGGGWLNRAERGAWAEAQNGVIARALTNAELQVDWIASVCTGGMILAHAGLLREHRATTNRSCFSEFEPLVGEVVDDRVVDDGRVITAGALTSGLDLGLHLIRRFCGEDAAELAAATLEYPPYVA